MRVVCLKYGNKYSDDYVKKLQSMCSRYVPEHEFVCLTDDPEPPKYPNWGDMPFLDIRLPEVWCHPLPFVPDGEGWWAKVGLFKPGLFPGRNLYLDLDIVISEDLSGLLTCLDEDNTKLWALDDFSYSLRRPRQGLSAEFKRFLGGYGTVNSSVMLWEGDSQRIIWDRFSDDAIARLHGDQNWITELLWPDQLRLIPEGWACSYKYDIQNGKPRLPITVFHGNPKPHQVCEAWVKEFWN